MQMNRRMLLLAGVVAAGSAGAALVAVTRGKADDRRPDRPEPSSRRAMRSDLDVLFRPGSEFVLSDGVHGIIDVQRAGRLRLPTGRLIAADPSWLPSWQRLGIAPYTTSVPAGSYLVTLALVRFQTDRPAAMVAAAKLTIRDAPVSTWELALRPGEDLATLADDEFFGVGVDVATVCLFDATVLTVMARKAEEQPQIFEVWQGDQPVEVVDAESKVNLIAFQSGLGDGHYPVWIGRTAGGQVCCFLVDMLIG
ncbi:DUF4241 domain-containing protein [Micromonospora echinaurantiaca]|uniref:DUF4241 domain-containing protein n=1 Tax=Micromonospora echinaurantiaca TaxID=47857 RepID=UPI0034457AAF